jgi:hypothetical protein
MGEVEAENQRKRGGGTSNVEHRTPNIERRSEEEEENEKE